MSKAIRITDLIENNKFSYSFEVTPNISLEEINNLKEEPAFFSITWHAKAHECRDFEIGPIILARELKRRGKEVLLHLSCDLLRKEYLDKLLEILEASGICNLFLVLGENFDESQSEFQNCKALIEYIKLKTGPYFCLGVAGFPDSEQRIGFLKEKVDSGADFIITQAFFEFSNFKNFVQKCQEIGIEVPIMPGIFVYETHEDLTAFANICKVKVSNDLLKYVKGNENISRGEMVRKLVLEIRETTFGSNHLHFFTLNKLKRVSQFIKNI